MRKEYMNKKFREIGKIFYYSFHNLTKRAKPIILLFCLFGFFRCSLWPVLGISQMWLNAAVIYLLFHHPISHGRKLSSFAVNLEPRSFSSRYTKVSLPHPIQWTFTSDNTGETTYLHDQPRSSIRMRHRHVILFIGMDHDLSSKVTHFDAISSSDKLLANLVFFVQSAYSHENYWSPYSNSNYS